DPEKQEIDWTGEVQIIALAGKDVPGVKRQLADWPAGLEWNELRLRADRSRRAWRPEAPCRLLVLARRKADARELLARASALLDESQGRPFNRPGEGIYFGSGPRQGDLAVLFPGQGAQYPGMLRDLSCHFPLALRTLANADRAFSSANQPRLGDLI